MRGGSMAVAFRVDASLDIGSGHVMRCLTLANELRLRGANCLFISREHSGHLHETIDRAGHRLVSLPVSLASQSAVVLKSQKVDSPTGYENFLGENWQVDAGLSLAAMEGFDVHWLVVDHYGLDAQWENAVGVSCQNTLVIDDLANRPHDCDLLLDQTLRRRVLDYDEWVPAGCDVMVGAANAMLRPEFSEFRSYSLQRRASPALRNLLITMGGMDKCNATGLILRVLESCCLPQDLCITVVMGSQAPWLTSVQQQAGTMRRPTQVRVDENNMAQLMADSDLAIGAAGSTAWERCCLGLPTLQMVLAPNQNAVCVALAAAGAARTIGSMQNLSSTLPELISEMAGCSESLKRCSDAALLVTAGQGADMVAKRMFRDQI